MQIKNEITIIKCDCCNKEIEIPQIYRNDGSYQDTYVKFEDLNICYTCSIELLDKYLSKLIPIEVVKENVKKLRKNKDIFPDLFQLEEATNIVDLNNIDNFIKR